MGSLPHSFQRDPEIDFGMLAARLRRLSGLDNRSLAGSLRISLNILKRIDDGHLPDYPTGQALVKALELVGGDLNGLTRR